jgi:GNAT superfamily N-acetyltransferase
MRTALLDVFDRQTRRDRVGVHNGVRYDRDGDVVCATAVDGTWNAVISTTLTASTVDAAIARQVEKFAALDRPFEWKWYSFDEPADLPERLVAAGFRAGEDEALMVARVDDIPPVGLPPGVRIRRCRTDTDVDAVRDAQFRAFGRADPHSTSELRAIVARDSDDEQVFVVEADGAPVCAGRLELERGTEFAGIWGAGTVPEWRGRGIYTALVAHRAAVARRAGFRYLRVDASPDSEPILRRNGFSRLATTRPYEWTGAGVR